MSINIKKLSVSFFLILLIGLFAANLAVAQGDCVCPAGAVCICNPLKAKDFPSLINAIIDFLWKFALVVVPIIIIIAGYYFVTSMGDPAKVSQARKMVLYAMIGLLIIGFSKGIVALIQEALKTP
jgi:hypothetical protein